MTDPRTLKSECVVRPDAPDERKQVVSKDEVRAYELIYLACGPRYFMDSLISRLCACHHCAANLTSDLDLALDFETLHRPYHSADSVTNRVRVLVTDVLYGTLRSSTVKGRCLALLQYCLCLEGHELPIFRKSTTNRFVQATRFTARSLCASEAERLGTKSPLDPTNLSLRTCALSQPVTRKT